VYEYKRKQTQASRPGGGVTPRRTVVRAALVVVGYAGVVSALAWASVGPWHQLHRVNGAVPFDTLVAAGAAAGAWLCVAWLTLGFLLAALATLPSRAGRWCAIASTRLAPVAVRRLACVVVGGALISGTGLAGTLPASAAPSPGVPAASSIVPDLDRPVGGQPSDSPATAATAATAGATGPTPGATPDPATSPAVASHGAGRAARVTNAPVHLVASPLRTSRPADEVVVHRGDTLWAIAARRLGPHASAAEIAAEWPRWFAANRHVVGGDPDLIRPGQRLRVPAPADTSAEETR